MRIMVIAMNNLKIQKVPKIYLAGKVSKNCWRHGIVSGLRGHHWNAGILPQAGFDYIGPFFVGCDHGCNHGPNTHGNGESCSSERDQSRTKVFQLCCDAVGKANIVFCYIESGDCPGTIFELGVAFKLSIPIFIAFGPEVSNQQINDFWFPCESAKHVYTKIRKDQILTLIKNAIAEVGCKR